MSLRHGCARTGGVATALLLAAAAWCAPAAASNAPADDSLRFEFHELRYDPVAIVDAPIDPASPDLVTTRSVVSAPVARGARATRWLGTRFRLAAAPVELQALYVSAANRGLRAYVNGVEVGDIGLTDAAHDYGWNYPLFFSIPPSLLRAGENRLDLLLVLNDSGNGSFKTLEIARHADLKRRYERVLFWRVTGPQITSLVAALAGLLALLLWGSRAAGPEYGWFGAACLFAVVRNAHFYVRELPISIGAFTALSQAALHWLVYALAMFALRASGARHARTERVLLAGTVLATLALALAVPLDSSRALWRVVYASLLWTALVALAGLAFAVRAWWRSRTTEMLLLLVAIGVTTAFGALDFLLLAGLRPPGARIYLMPYSTLVFTFVLGAILFRAFHAARLRQERFGEELRRRLQEREDQLAEQHGRLLALERASVAAGERQRIMRDIHDGLGGQLVTSLRLVETTDVPRAAVASMLRDAMDDLRLAIDALKPGGEDLLLMLANFRYRMEPRLARLGIELSWEVDAHAAPPVRASAQVLDLLRIVQEAVTNSLRHSGARKIAMRFRRAGGDDDWELTIADDGSGFEDDTRRAGHGLENMRVRAARAGAVLDVTSGPAGTIVRLQGAGAPAA